MAFNHYARIKRILEHTYGWVIKRIDQPTQAKNFKGETVTFTHYYRIFDATGQPINTASSSTSIAWPSDRCAP